MKLRSLFLNESLEKIKTFYSYHKMISNIVVLEEIANQPFDITLGIDRRGNSRILLPVECLENALELHLGRTSWVLPAEDKCSEVVYLSEFGVVSNPIEIETFEDKGCVVEGCCFNAGEFHVLRAFTKSRSFVNHRRFKKLLRILAARYQRITATCATCPSVYVGEDADWRFEPHGKGNRLLTYWQKLGLKSERNNKWHMSARGS